MALLVFPIGLRLLWNSEGPVLRRLPTPGEFGHLVSLISGSLQKLFIYYWSASNVKPRPPCLVRRTAQFLVFTYVLAAIMIVADSVLHYTSSSTPLRQAISVDVLGNLSLRLSDNCKSLNRSENNGMPCSKDYILYETDPEAFTATQSDIVVLAHNASDKVEIRFLPSISPDGPGLAAVLPKGDRIPAHLDYRASTVGAQTSCQLITERCNWSLTGPHDNYWAFNCTENFWGVLGSAPGTVLEPKPFDGAPLTYKPTDRLIFGYFVDEALKFPYNSQGADLTNGSMPLFPLPLPEGELLNPVYVGVAGRSPVTSQSPAADFADSPGFFNGTGYWYGFVQSCSFEVLDVQYTWSNGSISEVTAERSPNGTMAEIYHGYHLPGEISQLDINLQDAMVQATMEDNVKRFLQKWSELYSVQVVSVIGAFLVPCTSLAEQDLYGRLVSQIAIPPLLLVVFSAFVYAVFGLVVVTSAWKATNSGLGSAHELISVDGLAENFATDPSQNPAAPPSPYRVGITHANGHLKLNGFPLDTI
jgi:hypothetical protein